MMLITLTLLCVGLLNGDSYASAIESSDAADACALGGTCPSLRARFSALVSGDECWTVHERGVCTRVCLNSLKALQSRRAWLGCSRRCEWPKSVVESARDWTAWCESRVEPELPPQPVDTTTTNTNHLNAAAHNANTSSYGISGKLADSGSHLYNVIMIVASIILCALMTAAGFSVLVVKFPGTLNKLNGMAENLMGKGNKGNGILGNNPPDRAEMRRLAHGARRHLKAMRSNVD